jgi:hypothetical protein
VLVASIKHPAAVQAASGVGLAHQAAPVIEPMEFRGSSKRGDEVTSNLHDSSSSRCCMSIMHLERGVEGIDVGESRRCIGHDADTSDGAVPAGGRAVSPVASGAKSTQGCGL